MTRRLLLALVATLVTSSPAVAKRAVVTPPERIELPPPALMVQQGGKSTPLKLARVAVEARVVGHLARTSMTMTFQNTTSRVLEGDLYFPLPRGATISGYALDVNGVLVDGVVVDKHEARRIFETEVRKGVDPGLVEWTKGRNFKTRVFPIPANGSRTIRVSYVSEVDSTTDGATYVLPLAFRDAVGELSLRLEVSAGPAAPLVVRGGPKGLKFRDARHAYVAEATLKNATLTEDLRIALPKLDEAPVQVERAADGRVYFALRDAAVKPPADLKAPEIRRVVLWWDVSGSRARSDRATELDAVTRWLRGRGDVEVVLIPFRHVAEAPRRFELPRQAAALKAAIEGLEYDGGTQLGTLKRPRGLKRPDVNVVVTDGLSTIGAEEAALEAPTWVLSTASGADDAALSHLALSTGGEYLPLTRDGVGAVVDRIGAPVFTFMGARAVGASDVYPRLNVPVVGAFTASGVLEMDEATIELRYGVNGKQTASRKFVVKGSDALEGEILRRAWAQRRLDELLAFSERNASEIKALGKAHGLVTPGTSLLVLETLAQYVEHGVEPPASLPKMRAQWREAKAQREKAAKADEQSKLERIVKLWKERKAWYAKKYEYPPNFRFHDASKKKGEARPATAARRSPRPPSPEREEAAGDEAEAPQAKEKKKDGKDAPEPGVAIRPWDPDVPYLKALKAAKKADRWKVYLAQKREHGAAPAFYVDVAVWLDREGDKVLALQVLSNLAELELENPALLRVLAHRLAQIGELDLSVAVFEDVARMRPEEPQSFRDLALTLERRADAARGRKAGAEDYRRAARLLSKVVMERWDRFDEIELIALVELNHLLPKAKKAGVTEQFVDERLVAHLDMDVRIVMTWDADNTDMDLHVLEPSGEEAFYSHNRTTIGGLVSRDFTRGYGPEVYLLRKAMKGTYKVKTKYYGSSAAKLTGGVTLQVDVFTNYGRRGEKRRSMTLRLTERKEDFVVGELEF